MHDIYGAARLGQQVDDHLVGKSQAAAAPGKASHPETRL